MSDRSEADAAKITLYALQTCSHCKEVRKLLQQRRIQFDTIYVDMLVGEERNDTLRYLRHLNPDVSFPILQVGAKTIVGHKKTEIEAALDAWGP